MKLTASQCEELHQKADEAGRAAAESHMPTPMQVVERENPFDDTSPIKTAYAPVMDGVCGFAWINVKPGNSSYARWAKLNGHGRTDSYEGGVTIWVKGYGQSYERKYAYARAYAGVLTEYGVKAFPNGRLD